MLENDPQMRCRLNSMVLTGGYSDPSPGIYELAHEKVNELVAGYKPTVPKKVCTAIKNYFASKY